jgi:hypothetical protein
MPDNCPSECPFHFGDSNNCFQLSDYTDGEIAADQCHEDPDATTWGGTFATRIAPCKWNSSEANYKLDGDYMLSEPGTCLYFEPGDPSGKWVVEVRGYSPNGSEILLWVGEKDTGSDPTGKYPRTGGTSSTPSEFSVESC